MATFLTYLTGEKVHSTDAFSLETQSISLARVLGPHEVNVQWSCIRTPTKQTRTRNTVMLSNVRRRKYVPRSQTRKRLSQSDFPVTWSSLQKETSWHARCTIRYRVTFSDSSTNSHPRFWYIPRNSPCFARATKHSTRRPQIQDQRWPPNRRRIALPRDLAKSTMWAHRMLIERLKRYLSSQLCLWIYYLDGT